MSHDPQQHNARVLEQFRLQAPTFTETGFAASNLDWIVEQIAPRPTEQALDVACGAGHLGRALAPHVAHVEGIDLTPEMLTQGDRAAREAGLGNIGFALGDASALPWLDAQFDLVVCRLTLHQVADPAAVLREMVRVARPGGRIAVTDLLLGTPNHARDGETALDPAVIERNTHIERLRDPSHGQTLSITDFHTMLADAGAVIDSITTRDNPLDLEDWMQRSHTPHADRVEILRLLDDEISGGPATGLHPQHRDNRRMITHTWATVLARPTRKP